MVGIKVRTRTDLKKLRARTRRATIETLSQAGGAIRLTARRSIRRRKGASPPGQPPHTRQGALRRAIRYAVEKQRQDVVVGPTRSEIGLIGHTHEFGGTEPAKQRKVRTPNWRLEIGGHGPVRDSRGKLTVAPLRTARQVERAKRIAGQLPASQAGLLKRKRRYPPRPFMGPALERLKPRLPAMWARSIGP